MGLRLRWLYSCIDMGASFKGTDNNAVQVNGSMLCHKIDGEATLESLNVQIQTLLNMAH